MEQRLTGRRIAVLTSDKVDERELSETRKALQGAGATLDVISAGAVGSAATSPTEYAGLVLLDGSAALRGDQKAIQFVREMMLLDKPVAAVGSGALLLADAGALTGRRVASSPDSRAEVERAGGSWVDAAVTVDENLITGRSAGDLTPFEDRLIQKLAERADDWRVDELSESSFPASDPPPGPSAVGGEGASRSSLDRNSGL